MTVGMLVGVVVGLVMGGVLILTFDNLVDGLNRVVGDR